MPNFGEVVKSRVGFVGPYLHALSSAGLVLGNASGQSCLLLGAGGGQSATFYDGLNVTGVLDQASATTLAIGTNNATAITIGKSGATTTVAGALTSSQLLTASLGITITGGTAATEKIARTGADTLDINNGAIISTATAISLNKKVKAFDSAYTLPTDSIGDSAGRHWVGGASPQLIVFNNAAQGAGNLSTLTLAASTAATTALTASYARVRAKLDSASTFGAGMELVTTNSGNAEVVGMSISSTGAVTAGPVGTNIHVFNGVIQTKYDTGVGVLRMYCTTGTSILMARGNDTSTNGVFNFYSERSDGTNSLVIATTSTTGAWANIAGGSWGTISDVRLKKDIEPLTGGLSMFLALRPAKYNWRDEKVSPSRPTENFIADEVEKVNPKWVTIGGSETITEAGVKTVVKAVKQVHFDTSFNAYTVSAIQELHAQLTETRAELAALRAS